MGVPGKPLVRGEGLSKYVENESGAISSAVCTRTSRALPAQRVAFLLHDCPTGAGRAQRRHLSYRASSAFAELVEPAGASCGRPESRGPSHTERPHSLPEGPKPRIHS